MSYESLIFSPASPRPPGPRRAGLKRQKRQVGKSYFDQNGEYMYSHKADVEITNIRKSKFR